MIFIPGFVGQCSVVGHSLGSLILFDLLSGQKDSEDQVEEAVAETETDKNNEEPKMPRWEKDLSLEEVFTKLEISDHVATFTDQGIGIEELETCTEDDLKEAGLPLGPRKRLMSYLSRRQTTKSGSYSEFQASSVARQVSYCVGPAGTGQLSVRYPKLDIKPTSFFALGSPIGRISGIMDLYSYIIIQECFWLSEELTVWEWISSFRPAKISSTSSTRTTRWPTG